MIAQSRLAFGTIRASITSDSRGISTKPMATDYIRYDLLTQEAMRSVMRTVLIDAGTKGLPGEHHFFITFDTRAVDVKLSPRLLAQYPEEMTIVLQHQFWDLTVNDDVLEVGLSFSGTPETLTVPLAAIKGFFDPSVKFGLQFAEGSEESAAERPVPTVTQTLTAGNSPDEARGETATPPAPAGTPADPEKPAGAEVVRLDRFRKK